ncbi:hypothetical protein JHS3_08530 [Jeongeupia sp. HS-3]|nr:hypothetical protein JHS3_08530 [Jeongeupia sp. HS-3]
MAQEIAGETLVVIAVVIDPAQTLNLGIFGQYGSRHIEQGAQQWQTAGQGARLGHRGQTSQTIATQGIQQHGFGLIVLVMSEAKDIGVNVLEHGIAGSPCRSFDTTGTAIDRHPLNPTRHGQTLGNRHGRISPRIGVHRQAVMNVHGRE